MNKYISPTHSKHELNKCTCFVAVNNVPALDKNIQDCIRDYYEWAYIHHDPDLEDGKPHYHYFIKTNGTRFIYQIADKIGLPSQYIQVCRKQRSFRRYMLHLDSPEKHQYSLNDLVCSDLEEFKLAIQDEENRSIFDLYDDLRDVDCGVLSVHAFIERNYTRLSKMPFYQQIRVLTELRSLSVGIDINQKYHKARAKPT